MAKSVPVLVSGSILEWARDTAGYSVGEAAAKLSTTEVKLLSWEKDTAKPSIAKVRNMAKVYRRPLDQLFRTTKPIEPQVPHDFRRSQADGARRYLPQLRFQVRAAFQRRQLALELAGSLDLPIRDFDLRAKLNDDPEIVGSKIRHALGVSFESQRNLRQKNYNFWRSKIEKLDVLVFQVSTLPKSEMLGLALSFGQLPVIGVNRKLALNGRVFTLLHEFVHLMLETNGVCDLSEDYLSAPNGQKIEIFANRVAAAALLPKDILLAEPIVLARGVGLHDWSDNELNAISAIFGTSEETVLRRLLTLNRTSADYYAKRRAIYQARYEQADSLAKQKSEDVEFKRNMPQEVIADYGRYFAYLVLASYHQDRITLSDASNFLGVKAPVVEKVEKKLAARAS